MKTIANIIGTINLVLCLALMLPAAVADLVLYLLARLLEGDGIDPNDLPCAQAVLDYAHWSFHKIHRIG